CDITADLPKGNEQAGIKNHNAKHGCRICTIDYDELHDMSFNLAAGGRYHHNTTLQFQALNNVRTQAERDLLSMQYGIRDKPSIFDNIFRDRHLQCPHDAFHCMGGLANKMLQSTFTILTSKGEESFLNFWKHFEFPNIWSRQQNPITHLNSYFFSDYLRLTMIMPFLIDRTINNNNLLKETFINHVVTSCNLSRKNQVISQLRYLWVLFAKLVALIFKKIFNEATHNELKNYITQWGYLVAKIFPSITQLPNFHIIRHFDMHIRNFATLVNTAVPTKEMIHRLFKNIIPHSNKKNIELDFMQRYNTLQALRYLLDGGIDFRYNNETQLNFKELSKSQCIQSLLNSWYISKLQVEFESNIDDYLIDNVTHLGQTIFRDYKEV
ncbi:hypothetical protein RhiirA4_488574, partial [Rhizophagus irregularis]